MFTIKIWPLIDKERFFSFRLEFDLAMQSSDLKRALQCLITMSNSRDMGPDNIGLDLKDILTVTVKKENLVEAVQGIVKFAKEFLDLIDAADATAQAEIAREALKRLAAAGSVKGALQGHELRGLALRLANHGELTRLSVCIPFLYSHIVCFDFFVFPIFLNVKSIQYLPIKRVLHWNLKKEDWSLISLLKPLAKSCYVGGVIFFYMFYQKEDKALLKTKILQFSF